MTLSQSHLAYTPEIDHLEAALASARGIRLPFPTYAAASTYRHRLHHARVLDRRRNLEVYTQGDELYGTSVYDVLVCKIKSRGDLHYIYIENSGAGRLVTAEEIPEDDSEPSLERRPEPMLLEPPVLPGFKRRI